MINLLGETVIPDEPKVEARLDFYNVGPSGVSVLAFRHVCGHLNRYMHLPAYGHAILLLCLRRVH